MRHIVLSDDGEHIAEDAYIRLLAACYFPESIRDQEQGLFIARQERDEFLRVGEENYKPSELMQTAAQVLEKRTAQLFTVGLVGIAYVWLSFTKHKPSLNRASIIASNASYEFGGITWRAGLAPKDKERSKPVTGDPATIEQLFRRYRSVAHICAARVSASSYLENLHIWDQSDAVTASMIQTTATYQIALEKVTDTTGWNLWDVKKFFPAEASTWPALLPDKDLLHWIILGFEQALEKGQIKREDAIERGGT